VPGRIVKESIVKGDFTRSTFQPDKHYCSVRLQQGRVQLDADANEQADIAAYRDETASLDVIGQSRRSRFRRCNPGTSSSLRAGSMWTASFARTSHQ
jgi:hypothetical protein